MPSDTIHDRLKDLWAEGMAHAVEAMAGVKPAIYWQSEYPTEPVARLWWEQSFDFHPQPVAWVGAVESVWLAIGRRVLEAAGVDAAGPEEAKDTCAELLNQAFSSMAQDLASLAGQPVAALNGRWAEAAPAASGQTAVIQLPGQEPLPLLLSLGEALGSAVGRWPHVESRSTSPETAGFHEGEITSSKTLELLKDVELPVSISFGRTLLPLQEVLRLSAGSVIELDRAIDEPVALIVNDTVVALGEVVVIEGNYGLRIQQIMSRENLLRTSGVQ